VKKTRQILSTVALAATLGWAGVAHSGAMQTFTPLPTANCGLAQSNNCVQFGDFSVYSLALLSAQTKYFYSGIIPTTNPNPGDPYYVASSPGELGNNGYIVYGTGTNNNNVVTNGAGTLIDDAQQQPSGSGSHPPFVVNTTTETNPTFTGDLNTSWDATLSAMRTELASGSDPLGKFIIYFNLNETGTDGLAGIDLMAWFHITLVDTDGILPDKNYYLTGSQGSLNPSGPMSTAAPSLVNDTDPNWVRVHGTICISATAGFLGFGPCDATQTAAGGRNVDQNLGANEAAFAIFNQDLSDNVLNSGYDIMRGNWQFMDINNGYEQEFSALTPFLSCAPTDPTCHPIPEPGTLSLFGLAFASLALLRSRKYRS